MSLNFAFHRKSLIKSINKLKQTFLAVALTGAKQVAKSSLLRLLNEETSGTFVDLERQSDAARIALDPDFFLESVKLPLYIDEAQLLPDLFPALRVAIDRDRTKRGRYFLSGSSSPELQTGIEESLAGRIGFINIEALTLEESWSKDESPLYETLQNGDRKALELLTQRFAHEKLFLPTIDLI